MRKQVYKAQEQKASSELNFYVKLYHIIIIVDINVINIFILLDYISYTSFSRTHYIFRYPKTRKENKQN